jgi:hypothetical protein
MQEGNGDHMLNTLWEIPIMKKIASPYKTVLETILDWSN